MWHTIMQPVWMLKIEEVKFQMQICHIEPLSAGPTHNLQVVISPPCVYCLSNLFQQIIFTFIRTQIIQNIENEFCAILIFILPVCNCCVILNTCNITIEVRCEQITKIVRTNIQQVWRDKQQRDPNCLNVVSTNSTRLAIISGTLE